MNRQRFNCMRECVKTNVQSETKMHITLFSEQSFLSGFGHCKPNHAMCLILLAVKWRLHHSYRGSGNFRYLRYFRQHFQYLRQTSGVLARIQKFSAIPAMLRYLRYVWTSAEIIENIGKYNIPIFLVDVYQNNSNFLPKISEKSEP